MLKLLIKYGAHITVKTSIGAGLMHLAAQSDNVHSIAYFSMRHKESMKERDNDGYTPLHWAAMNGSKNVISYLIGLSERDQWSSMMNA